MTRFGSQNAVNGWALNPNVGPELLSASAQPQWICSLRRDPRIQTAPEGTHRLKKEDTNVRKVDVSERRKLESLFVLPKRPSTTAINDKIQAASEQENYPDTSRRRRRRHGQQQQPEEQNKRPIPQLLKQADTLRRADADELVNERHFWGQLNEANNRQEELHKLQRQRHQEAWRDELKRGLQLQLKHHEQEDRQQLEAQMRYQNEFRQAMKMQEQKDLEDKKNKKLAARAEMERVKREREESIAKVREQVRETARLQREDAKRFEMLAVKETELEWKEKERNKREREKIAKDNESKDAVEINAFLRQKQMDHERNLQFIKMMDAQQAERDRAKDGAAAEQRKDQLRAKEQRRKLAMEMRTNELIEQTLNYFREENWKARERKLTRTKQIFNSIIPPITVKKAPLDA